MFEITLHNISGFNRLSGWDTKNNLYVQFSVDYFAGQEDGECAVCGASIDMGWQCLDGGEEYCYHHVRSCNYPNCIECERLAEYEISQSSKV